MLLYEASGLKLDTTDGDIRRSAVFPTQFQNFACLQLYQIYTVISTATDWRLNKHHFPQRFSGHRKHCLQYFLYKPVFIWMEPILVISILFQLTITACNAVAWSHLSRTGRLMLPKAEWNAPVCSLLQRARRPLKKAGRTPGRETQWGQWNCWPKANSALTKHFTSCYLLEGVEGDVEASSGFLPTEFWCPVDVLEDELDRLAAAVSTVDDIALLIHDDGGSGWARGLQLHLQTH